MKNRAASFRSREGLLREAPIETLRQLVDGAGLRYGEKTAFCQIENKTCVSYSYLDLQSDVNALGTALWNQGMQDCHFAVLGENSYGWVVCYLTAALLGTAVPLDKELPVAVLSQMLRDSDVQGVLCSEKYADTARQAIQSVGATVRVLCWDAQAEAESVQRLIETGRKLLQAGETGFADRKIEPDALAAILFTSGTTGANKAVMLTHQNICANVYAIAQIIPYEFVSFSVLPLNHAFECNCHMLPAIYCGVEICINSSLKRMMHNLRLFRPGMSVVVPMFIDEIYNGIWNEARRNGRQYLLLGALALSRCLCFIGVDIREKLFSQVRESLGGNLSLLVCGGAPLNPRSARGLENMGIDIISGYGITECAPLVSVQLGGRIYRGGVGAPVPGVSLRIEHKGKNGVGEVWVRGNNVTPGYYRDEASNRASFDAGWFKTGDYGKLDHRGRLRLYGRKKNLIVLENGKNVHPEEIESMICEYFDYVRDVVVYEATTNFGKRRRRCIGAVISIDPRSRLGQESEESRNHAVRDDIHLLNRILTPYKRIELLRVTIDEFEKTTTRKVIRQKAVKQGAYIQL